MNLSEILRIGETQEIEFKESLSLTKEGCQGLCGMINTEQAKGMVLFGIRDKPAVTIVGIEGDLDKAQRSLVQHIKSKFDPTIICNVCVLSQNDRSIVQLSAQRSKDVPYHEYDGRAYIREGTQKRQLTLAEKMQLSKKRNRDQHNGPWICDKCGAFAGMSSSVEITNAGPKKTYGCSVCGGEYWPA
ncbi:MAG: ATP-binding protein [Desulfobulbaceae bacterium]|nr:ATP-binding protein [Desulfobulbaceae bacterium]